MVGHANYRTAKVLDYLERTRVPNPFEQTDLYPVLMLGELVQTTAGKWITHLTIPMPQRSPPWTESGPRGPRRLPRTRWRRTHQLALPHLRRRGLRAADEYALLGAQRASHGAPFHATKLSHLAPHGWRAESCVELCPQTVIGSQL